MNSLLVQLSPYARRAKLRKMLAALLLALTYAAPGGLLALWLLKAFLVKDAFSLALAVSALITLLIVLSKLPLPSQRQVALSCDHHLQGYESVTTALHLQSQESTNPFVSPVLKAANKVLAKGAPGDVFPLPHFNKFIFVIFLWGFAFFLSHYSPFSFTPPKREKAKVNKAAAAAEAKRLLEAAKTIEKHSSQSIEMIALAERLRKEASQLNKVGSSPKTSLSKTMKRLSRLGEEVEAKSQKNGNQGVSVGAALSALRQSKKTSSLAKALQSGNKEQMNQAIASLLKAEDEAAAQAAQAIRDAASELDPYLNEFVKDEKGAKERQELDEAYQELLDAVKKMSAKDRASMANAAQKLGKMVRHIRHSDLDAKMLRQLTEALRQGRLNMGSQGKGKRTTGGPPPIVLSLPEMAQGLSGG